MSSLRVRKAKVGYKYKRREKGGTGGICIPVPFNVSTTLISILRYFVQKLMESQPIKGATYAIASAFRLVSAFQYVAVHHHIIPRLS